jgi:hypothetical protein
MIIFTKPKKLNGIQLREELRDAGVEIDDGRSVVIIGNELHLDILETDKEKAEEIVSKHIGIDKEITIEEKLASVGLSLPDLKAALGL